ncbi:MAG TPA: LysM peptidoglycan-binding domain-containing protein [Blastocatellia bacterium]|nr:LysM peptidoglycan-binding domain-containing protein [Blastocatellia bacterium]
MGIFDKMFGRGADNAPAGSEQKFNQLKQKYQTVLNTIEKQNVRLQNLHVEGDKLFIKGTAPSDQAKNAVWDQIKLVDPNASDLTADITVEQQRATAVGGATSGGQTYTVKSGDTLTKISQQFYGSGNEYMRIFYANREKLSDPDKIQAGQQLIIPPDDNA